MQTEKEKEAQIAKFEEIANSPQAKASTLDKLEKAYNSDIRLRVVSVIVEGVILLAFLVFIISELYEAENVPGRSRLYVALAGAMLAIYIFLDKFVFATLKDRSENKILALEMICKEHDYKEKR